MRIRQAGVEDAQGIAAVLQALTAAGMRTRPDDTEFVRDVYLGHPGRICCAVAADAGAILGLQVLFRAEADNPYGTPVGWGIIGTQVHPQAHGRGIGRALFAETLARARDAALTDIEAYIGAANAGALAYYEAMGFRTWRRPEGIEAKRLTLT